MRLLTLKVRRMPGFKERGFRYEEGVLQEGINVILGSNGSGKTTSCVAVRKLLWPEHPSVKDLSPVSLQGGWEESGELIEMEVEGGRHRVSCKLTLPPEQNALCYTILLDDLFEARDDEFANAIAKIAYGGCDLDLIRKQFVIPPRMGQRENKEHYEKKRRLDEIARSHLDLEVEENSLKEIAEKIREAKRAQEILEKIKIYSELKIKKKLLEEVTERLAELPLGSAFIREEDEREYRQIILKEGGEEQSSCLNDLQLLELEEKISLLQELERNLKEVKSRTLEMEVGFKQRFSLLGIDKDAFPSMKVAHIGELQRLWECWHAKVCELNEWDARIKAMDSREEPTYSPQTLREGIRLLHAFLHAEELKWLHRLLWSGPLLSLICYKYPLVYMGVSFFCFSLLLLLRKSSSRFFKRSFLELGIPSPEIWTLESIQQHSAHLEKMWGEAARFFSDKETAQIIAVRKKTSSDEAENLYQKLREAGFSGEKLSWIPFMHELQRASELFVEVKKQEALICDEETRYHALLQEIGIKNAREGVLLLSAHQKKTLRQRELQDLGLRKKEILTRCKIDAENPEEEWNLLSECAEKREIYWTFAREKAALEINIREMEVKLQGDLKILQSETFRVEMQAKAALHDHLIERQAAIRQKLDSAAHRLAFEEAACAVIEAEGELATATREFVHKALREFMVGKVEKLFESEFQPEVFKRADAWFTRFTRGAYRLHLIRRRSFAAYDAKEEEVKDLNALSRGTRIQLILAIRLAFMETAEYGGPRLPLFLDEVMSHADDERFQYMAEALLEVAKTGRQIFYFTCQKGCAESFLRAVPESTFLNVIDLDKMKRGEECREMPLKPVPLTSFLPEPHGKNLYDYALELNAPGLSRESPPSTWHLCHFADSSEELHALALQNVLLYGQYKNLSEKGLLKVPKFTEKGNIAEHFYALTQIGRGRKVTLEDLKQGGVTEKFLDKVYTLAKTEDFDSKKLMLALENKEVQGFREKAREELKEFLIESGCLDERTPLDKEEIRARLWQHSKETATSLSPEKIAAFINTLCA